ncbi:type II toxin-antitoxin system death-on-curing family toxin, partial [Collinsella sp. HCP3S3_E6]|uniref:type II toxin-antitoxin system death-on-curing family toxin n=2 Tax=Collinsella TaxID=102106 RepID=UPI003F8988D8
IAFPRILTSAIKILGDNRFLLSTAREAAPYTNIRHAIRMKAPQGNEPNWELDYTEALEVVRSLPFYSSFTLFGRERDNQFAGIISTLYQGFGDQDLYPSVQAKAANLLYLVVKDHPFLDGNKRSAAALFIHFLDKNGVLRDGERLRVEGNALAAMTLMVALSDPSEKDSMVALVENFIA